MTEATAAPHLPTGTVTFLFTDIERSTDLVRRLGEDYPKLLGKHHQLLADLFGRYGGHEVDRQGDALFFAFGGARDAVAAAVDAQRALAGTAWPHAVEVRIRIGIHTGEPGLAETGYHGIDVVRAARICAAAHGGQVLVSALTGGLLADETQAGMALRDLGAHKLKDLECVEQIYQLLAEGLETEFPPLRDVEPALSVAGREQELAAAAQATMSASVSRASTTPVVALARPPGQQFVGRARELDELRAILDEAATGRGYLVLVTGEPGIGKTSLIQSWGGLRPSGGGVCSPDAAGRKVARQPTGPGSRLFGLPGVTSSVSPHPDPTTPRRARSIPTRSASGSSTPRRGSWGTRLDDARS